VPGKSRRAAATAYGRRPKSTSDDDDDGLVAVTGHRHGHRSRSLAGFFGRVEIEVPRARLDGQDGKTTEWNSKVLRAYQRRTVAADALMASTYLVGREEPDFRRI
jgi:putative transposase